MKENGKVYFLPARRIGGEGKSAGLRGILSIRNLCDASVRPLMEGVVESLSTKTWAVPVHRMVSDLATSERCRWPTCESNLNLSERCVVCGGDVDPAFAERELVFTQLA